MVRFRRRNAAGRRKTFDRALAAFLCGLQDREYYSNELKRTAGFGKDGAKGFEGIITGLQMQLYLCVRDFRQRKNKRGESYGWPIAVYATLEHLWGYDYVTSAYNEDPEISAQRIADHMRDFYPIATPKQLRKVIGVKVCECKELEGKPDERTLELLREQ